LLLATGCSSISSTSAELGQRDFSSGLDAHPLVRAQTTHTAAIEYAAFFMSRAPLWWCGKMVSRRVRALGAKVTTFAEPMRPGVFAEIIERARAV